MVTSSQSSTTESAALVLFSGGQDSTVCLAWALDRFERVETIGFDYRQRHSVELECRVRVLERIADVLPDTAHRLGSDHTLDLGVLGEMSETALTRDREIEMAADGLPSTFVPGRNLIFLSLAGALAYRRGISHLVGGMCETDYSGYPDCRRETIDAVQASLALGMDRPMTIETPLMYIDKLQTWRMAQELGGEGFVQMIVEQTHTCYLGERTTLHAWGYGCGSCPACDLRARGWKAFTDEQHT